MKIILDTDKKTITVPYNYQAKLTAMKKLVEDSGGNGEGYEYKTYMNNLWAYCIEHSDECVLTGKKPGTKK